jgi:hypothetical protein
MQRSSRRPLPEESYEFRAKLIDLLDRLTPGREFFYVDEDRGVMACPVCGGALTVRFRGRAAAAELDCIDNGCGDDAILARLREGV